MLLRRDNLLSLCTLLTTTTEDVDTQLTTTTEDMDLETPIKAIAGEDKPDLAAQDSEASDEDEYAAIHAELEMKIKGLFWAKDTNRYVARYNKQKKCFPVRKIKSPTKLLAAKRLQRIRAKTFAETGICGPNPDDSQEP